MSRMPCSLLLCGCLQLRAQPWEPPKVLRIIREDIKEGRTAAHEKTVARLASALARNKYPANYIGLNALTGPSQAWFPESYGATSTLPGTSDAR
jgi:hypothetical protein